jgi:hypothetical protein
MTTEKESPYISLVVTSRNDNHGGTLQFRMQTFLNCFLEQCRRHRFPAEIVMVEWNPPQDRPPLADALDWSQSSQYCPVRIIQVPAEIHKRYQHSEALPLFQMIAKNVGIRRAHAPFVLATNIDILFSEELIRHFAARRLKEGLMYRMDRYDVPAQLPTEKPVEQLLDFCRQNPIRVHKRWGSVDARTGQYYNGAMTWKHKLNEVRIVLTGEKVEKRLHTNGCGDFTLMSKDHWFKIRAHPEFHMFSFNLDGLLCQIAYFGGAREQVLRNPMQIYHIEHSVGSGWTPEGQEALLNRIEAAGIPQLDYQEYRKLSIRMREDRRPIMFNEENWGLADHELKETTIS